MGRLDQLRGNWFSMQIANKPMSRVEGLEKGLLQTNSRAPNEAFPILEILIIQHAVKEPSKAGITDLSFVTDPMKGEIKHHFDQTTKLKLDLRTKGNAGRAKITHAFVPDNINCICWHQLRQPDFLHTVLCSKSSVGYKPVTVLLTDDATRSDLKPKRAVLAANAQIARDKSVVHGGHAGKAEKKSGDCPRQTASAVARLFERPCAGVAPSHQASIGCNVIEPEVFYPLSTQAPGMGGEMQRACAIIPRNCVGSFWSEMINISCNSSDGRRPCAA